MCTSKTFFVDEEIGITLKIKVLYSLYLLFPIPISIRIVMIEKLYNFFTSFKKISYIKINSNENEGTI